MRWSEEKSAGGQNSAALAQPLADIAPQILKRSFKRARRRGAGFAKQSPAERHRLRIALKKLRYATEMLAQLYDAGKSRRVLQLGKRLQEELGKANDLHISRDLVSDLAHGKADAVTIAATGGTVLGWHARDLEARE